MNAGTHRRIEVMISNAAEALGSLDHPAAVWLARISNELHFAAASRSRAHRAADRAALKQLDEKDRRRQPLRLLQGGLEPPPRAKGKP